ncbi:MAG: hypothetical protein GXO45_01955 [Aquificae bacterium]|nr:hypothetical protein [Aquificota bacterium]
MSKHIQLIVRIVIALAVLTTAFVSNDETKTIIIVASLTYAFFSLVIPKNSAFKYVQFVIDVMFITIIMFITGYSPLSLLLVPLFTEYVRSIRDTILFLIFFLLTLVETLYITNFTEITVVFIAVASLISIYGLYQQFKEEEEKFKELEEQSKNLYIKAKGYEEKIDELNSIISVYKSLQTLRKEKHPIREWIYDLDEKLGTDGIVLFDRRVRKCFNIKDKDVECKPEILKYIKEPIMEFTNHEVNKILNNIPYVWTIVIEEDGEVFGILVIASKLKKLDKEVLDIIKDQLTLYFLENRSG